MACKSFKDGETTAYEEALVSGTIRIVGAESPYYPSFYNYGVVNGDSSTLNIDYELSQPFPMGAFIVVMFPKQNWEYEDCCSMSSSNLASMLDNVSSVDVTWDGDGNTYDTTVTVTEDVEVDASSHEADGLTYDRLAIEVSDSDQPVFTSGTITIQISGITLPVNTKPLGSFVLYTGSTVDDKIETARDGTADTMPSLAESSLITTTAGNAVSSASFLDDLDGIDNANAHYSFTFRTANPVPADEGYLVITVPSDISIPNNDPSGEFDLDCSAECSDSSPSWDWDDSTRLLVIRDIFDSYVESGATITFSIKGWNNPSTTSV